MTFLLNCFIIKFVDINKISPDLLVFLIGSFKEQKEALTSRVYSPEEIDYIWLNVSKIPLAQDASKTFVFHIHQNLLKQPKLSSYILEKLWNLYSPITQITLQPDILEHHNFDFVKSLELFESFIQEENWLFIYSILKNKNNPLFADHIVENSQHLERIKFLLHFKKNSSEAKIIEDILKICIKSTASKKFLNDTYFYLQREQILNLDYLGYFIENKLTNLKILSNIYTKQNSSSLINALILHDNISEDLLFEIISTHRNFDSSLFNTILNLLKNKTLNSKTLEFLFKFYLNQNLIIEQIINQPHFNNHWVWECYLNESSFDSLNQMSKELLKKALNI